jgi:hypothetical protein
MDSEPRPKSILTVLPTTQGKAVAAAPQRHWGPMNTPRRRPQQHTTSLNTICFPTGKAQLLPWRKNTLLTLLLAAYFCTRAPASGAATARVLHTPTCCFHDINCNSSTTHGQHNHCLDSDTTAINHSGSQHTPQPNQHTASCFQQSLRRWHRAPTAASAIK